MDAPDFTEDPLVAVQQDDRAVALDPFVLLRMAQKHPEWGASLV